jgi:cytochrome oxidase assembly protein ShyY1
VCTSNNDTAPRFAVAQHDLQSRPNRLFWIDVDGMRQLAGLSSSTPYVIAVVDGSPQHQTWPVQPSAEKVGEFKVSPAVHASYALTWYSLSLAGLYLTRKMILRGR